VLLAKERKNDLVGFPTKFSHRNRRVEKFIGRLASVAIRPFAQPRNESLRSVQASYAHSTSTILNKDH